MSVKKKNLAKLCILGALLLILLLIYVNELQKFLERNKNEITIGVFSDSYWDVQNGYSYQILDDAIRIFEEENPGIRVSYVSGIMKGDYSEWLAEELLKGTAPDLFFVSRNEFSDLAEIGAIKDLSELISEDETFDEEAFYKPAYESGKFRNGQYALPYECAPKLMFVNKSILNKENIPIPNNNWTWDKFYEICEKVTKDTNDNGIIDQFGVVGYSWEDAFYENEVHLFDEGGTQCSLTSDNVEESILLLEKLDSLSKGYRITAKDFDYGRVAFMPMSFSEYRAYKSYPLSIKKYSGFEWECIEMPAGPKGDNLSELDTLMIGMNRNTAQQDAAWEFLKLLTSDPRIQSEIFDYSEGVSVIRNVTESDETKIVLSRASGDHVTMSTAVLSGVLETAVNPPGFRSYENAMEQVNSVIESILEGNKNIKMELIVKNREINRYLQDLQLEK